MKSTVDEYWRTTLRWDPDSAGVTHVPGLPSYQGIYVLRLGAAVCIAGGDGITAVNADDAMNPRWWADRLGERAVAVFGPSIHYYLDEIAHLPAGTAISVERAALASLEQACPAADWNEGGFADAEAAYFGIYDGEALVAAANLTEWNGGLRDIGVLTRPDRRGRGLGRTVAAAAARQAIVRYGSARYRALATNAASRAIAADLGCTEYGANLAIRLRN